MSKNTGEKYLKVKKGQIIIKSKGQGKSKSDQYKYGGMLNALSKMSNKRSECTIEIEC
ncbi:hypothetical protein NCCP133_25490 [Cytobacillus sp. NCCP-133]|nr:hypothetical protein NCCP133_25490 [Cytobacillus sp. NCCP-133]